MENTVPFPVNLYCETAKSIQTIDSSMGEQDFRKTYIVDDGRKKFVVKYMSNAFSTDKRIEKWIALADAYRNLGIDTPKPIPTLQGELVCHERKGNRDFYIYAEEFAKYPVAKPPNGRKRSSVLPPYMPDVLRAVGKVANAKFDIMDFPSGYCLLEPFSADDTTDETTECAICFTDFVKKELPAHAGRAQYLLNLFYQNQKELQKVYKILPTSCFQADLNDSNILVDENGQFKGLVDFNLCGKEPILNYTVRASLQNAKDPCLYGEKGTCLYFYDKSLETVRMEKFMQNMKYIEEEYLFTEMERAIFPVLFRYLHSYWWQQLDEIHKIKQEPYKIEKLFDYLETQMTRDDIRLP